MNHPGIRNPQTDSAGIFLVGGAMGGVAVTLREMGLPVDVHHMGSIDELLLHVEDHEVACAVVDQSRPTESRGLKLALLAASRKVRHLMVLAPPGGRAEIEAIHGVHRVLRTPIAPKQVIDAVLAYADDLADTQSVPADLGAVVPPSPADHRRASAPAGIASAGSRARRLWQSVRHHSLSIVGDAARTPWQRFLPLASMVYKKLAMVILASLFALFLSYGTIIVFFLTSSRWSLPIELSKGHELVLRAEKDLGEMRVRENQVMQALNQAEGGLAIAERDKRDARMRLEITGRSIDLELTQQSKLLEETRAHILRLKQIIADFRNENGRGTFARNLEQAYAKRTITKKALEAGTLAVLESLHRMAVISNELAVNQIEENRIGTRVEFLKSLRAQIDKPEIRILTAASSDMVYLARDAIADQNIVAEADEIIANRLAEVQHLRNSLGVVQENIATLLATPVGRAITAPVTVVFVPYENTDHYASHTPLYSCGLMVVFCSQVGVTGDAIPGETNAVHPLFGKPLRGVFVEAILENKDGAKKEILHAGRPPLFF